MVSGRWGREREVEQYPDSSSQIVEIVLTQLESRENRNLCWSYRVMHSYLMNGKTEHIVHILHG